MSKNNFDSHQERLTIYRKRSFYGKNVLCKAHRTLSAILITLTLQTYNIQLNASEPTKTFNSSNMCSQNV